MIPEWPDGTAAVLSVAGPHAIPVSTALRAGDDEVLLALGPNRETLARLREDGRCCLTVFAPGLAFTLHGVATIAAEDAAGTVAVRIAVGRCQDHRQPTFAIDSGPAWRWTDDDARERDAAVRAALRSL